MIQQTATSERTTASPPPRGVGVVWLDRWLGLSTAKRRIAGTKHPVANRLIANARATAVNTTPRFHRCSRRKAVAHAAGVDQTIEVSRRWHDCDQSDGHPQRGC